jgi:hypothetical protein
MTGMKSIHGLTNREFVSFRYLAVPNVHGSCFDQTRFAFEPFLAQFFEFEFGLHITPIQEKAMATFSFFPLSQITKVIKIRKSFHRHETHHPRLAFPLGLGQRR